ncbi:unnamed protein product [Parnassius mnemosyne]|uniref:Cytochrome P450 n=1 Tax=Parnassius mnemosyne TaxID=213953 RepID=A0AAV1M275_9NEOP
MALTLAVIIALITIFAFYCRLRYDHAGRLLSRIPGPRGWPFLGNALTILVSSEQMLLLPRSIYRMCGNISKLEAFGVRVVNEHSADDVEILFSTTRFNRKQDPYTFLKPWLREGLLISNGEKWQQRRKLLTKAFHCDFLKTYVPTFNKQTEHLLSKIQCEVGNDQTEILPLISKTTLKIMCQTSMGTSMDEAKLSIVNKYFEALNVLGSILAYRYARIWLHLDLIFKFTKIFIIQNKSIKILHEFTKQIIQERKIDLKNNTTNEFNNQNEVYGRRRLEFLDILIQNEKEGKIDLEGIREEVDTFMFEGHDTTAMALSFMIMRIANELEIQNQLVEEIINIFGVSQRAPTVEDLNNMKYLECCIKESLRLYPSVPFMSSFTTEDVTLSGYTVPAGTYCNIHVYDIHRRKDYYPESEKFIPERFLPETTKTRHPYAYIPFSAGSRNCIGQKFAILEMKTLMSGLIRRFRLEPVTKPEDLIFKADIVLRTSNPLYTSVFIWTCVCENRTDAMALTLAVTIVLITIFAFYCRLRYGHAGRLLSRIPGPRGWPLLGNALTILVSSEEMFLLPRSFYRMYGDISKLEAFGVRVVNIHSADDVEILFSTTRFNRKQDPYTFLRPWLREGLLISNGEKWHQRRKLLTKAFHFDFLKTYVPIFNKQTEHLLSKIQCEVGNDQTEILPLISKTTLKIMCQTSMGTSMDEAKLSIANKYFEALNMLGSIIAYRYARIWLHLDLIFKFTKTFMIQNKSIRILHEFTKQIIQERKIYLKNKITNQFNTENEVYGLKGRQEFLDILIQNEKEGKIDFEGIREEVDTFMFEGHDTTAMALSFMIMRIANEPEIQNQLVEEMINIFGESQRAPTVEDLNNMKYLECCIKESLRLYPSVPFMSRFTTEDVTLSGYTVPAGTYCNIHVYDIHRRNDYYPEPEKFIPERFLPETTKTRHPYAYIPFSAGPRNCIGQKFAMLEMKTVMSGLIRRFRLEPVTKPEDLIFKADIVLRTSNPLYVRFRTRQY